MEIIWTHFSQVRSRLSPKSLHLHFQSAIRPWARLLSRKFLFSLAEILFNHLSGCNCHLVFEWKTPQFQILLDRKIFTFPCIASYCKFTSVDVSPSETLHVYRWYRGVRRGIWRQELTVYSLLTTHYYSRHQDAALHQCQRITVWLTIRSTDTNTRGSDAEVFTSIEPTLSVLECQY